MMILKNKQQEVKITIEGYAYPFSRDDWDSNWLSVNVEVQDFTNSIHFENNDNCLLSMELEDLKNWFVYISEKPNSEIEINFMEPNLGFYYSDKKIKIQLKYDFNPNIDYHNPNAENFDSAFGLEFHVEKEQINLFIKELDNLIKKYPKRNDPR